MRETDDEQIVRELTEFMRSYEAANNSHEVDRVLPFIASEASYWFSDGSHYGHAQIRLALGTTFETIQEERYTITELVWVCVRSMPQCADTYSRGPDLLMVTVSPGRDAAPMSSLETPTDGRSCTNN